MLGLLLIVAGMTLMDQVLDRWLNPKKHPTIGSRAGRDYWMRYLGLEKPHE